MLSVRKVQIIGVVVVMVMALLTGCNKEKTKSGHQAHSSEGEKEEESMEFKPIKPKELAGVFLAGEYERVYQQTSKEFQQQISLQQIQEIGKSFHQGIKKYDLQASVSMEGGMTQYIWTDDTDQKGMVAILDEDDTITGLQVLPLQSHPKTDEKLTETVFYPPFEGDWFVGWGGTNELINYHYAYENQRYAFDFLITKDDLSYDGKAKKNESYYAFGKNVLAPADGKVVQVENDIKDNYPVGGMNEDQPAGNHVIIDHGNNEYSLLAHFKQGSIEVKEGDQVKQGNTLGLVGNSGNSSEPHIHFHVADSPDLADSTSIRIRFADDEDWIRGDIKGQ